MTKIKSIYKDKSFNLEEVLSNKDTLIQTLLDEQQKRFKYLRVSNHSTTCDRLVSQINEIGELIYKYHPLTNNEVAQPTNWYC